MTATLSTGSSQRLQAGDHQDDRHHSPGRHRRQVLFPRSASPLASDNRPLCRAFSSILMLCWNPSRKLRRRTQLESHPSKSLGLARGDRKGRAGFQAPCTPRPLEEWLACRSPFPPHLIKHETEASSGQGTYRNRNPPNPNDHINGKQPQQSSTHQHQGDAGSPQQPSTSSRSDENPP